MKILPNYEKHPTWERYEKELDVEYKQSIEEGKDIEQYKNLFDTVFALPNNEYKEQLADVLYKIVTEAPMVENYPHEEPSDLPSILAARKPYDLEMTMPDDETLEDKILGAWYGRICGCLLGKPIESIMSWELQEILKRTGNYPMTRYIDKEEITDEVQEGIGYPIRDCACPRDLGYMPPDDDTNYMVVALRLLQWHGRDFTSEHMAYTWLGTQMKNAYCTAERIAYRNFVMGYLPPESAQYKNPYREWIGAQIRGDVFGYINPCDPQTAADMAHRDASISHIKNGIYGEMWVAAMLAAAFGCNDVEKIIRRGMAEIPANSRTYKAIDNILNMYHNGVSMEDCFADIHSRWDERNGHDWTHTVSNAEIVAAALMYGQNDYSLSVGLAVQTGLDTDCNGATVGSIMGVMLGYNALPTSFTERVNDTLCTNIAGYNRVSIKAMAKQTMPFVKKTV